MNNELYRKLTSITLMTIMFAGGMTIAIPGETPVAVAQTGMLSVSATAAPENSFGGPQIIEIVVDDPSRSETDVESKPDVTIDDTTVTLVQADTGKWYAYVTSGAAVPTDFTLTLNDDDTPVPGRDGENFALQTISFDDDSDIDVVLGSETITLHYEEDLDDLATVSTDRTGVPEGGQVHVTVSDFRLNLNPLVEDAWVMYADGSVATHTDTIPTVGAEVNWVGTFGGNGGEFTVTDDDDAVAITNDETTELVILRETGSNTGVFESQDKDDSSNIAVTGGENDDFTIAYADKTSPRTAVQVFIEDFDSTLVVIADGTWDSGESLTVRLTDENLNTNTLTDQDMELGDDNLPILMFGAPITIATVSDITPVVTDPVTPLGDRLTIDEDTHVGTLMKSTTWNAANSNYTFTVTLTEAQKERLQDATLGNYIHYSSDLDAATNAHTADLTAEPAKDTTDTPVENGARIIVHGDADGIFNITFTAPAEEPAETLLTGAAVTANDAIRTAVTDATADNLADAAAVKNTIGNSDASEEFKDEVLDNIADDADLDEARATVKRIALEHIVTHDFAIAADIFTFGDGANHAIYRALLAETDSASGVFEGTIEYQMLNQRTEAVPPAQSDANGASDELVMILDTDYTGSDAPEVLYDADGPGGDEPANASEDAPTNTGEVSVDASTYRVSDDVTITLVDADLNTDSGAREIYRIANSDGTITPTVASIAIGSLGCESEIGDVSLRETASDSGVFEGSFTVPGECGTGDNPPLTTGESITVTYVDFRDETGAGNEWTDSATIGADTGSVSLDRTVYPVPPPDNTVTITVSVDDADEDTSSSSKQTISGVELKVAGETIDLGELKETEPDSGIFESTVTVDSHANRDNTNNNNRIEQGDIITVRYTDESDASGNENSVSDSATFDLRNAVLQSDKSVYVIGQDALLTLIEADLNLDSGTIDNIGLDRINWDSEAYDGSLDAVRADLGPVPTNLRETGENTGIFQVVITISEKILGNSLERGEEITLKYEDRGPSGADYVTDDERDVELQIETSNFGATVELDQNVYTWTDKVFITVVASDYNFDSNIVDEIGTDDKGEITIRTRADELGYRLAETGPDTGVFTGELVLTGDADAIDDGPSGSTSDSIAGPTDGTIKTRTSDGISISFDYSDSEAPLVASALIRWNVGEVQWLEASYAATGSGVVRIIDPDMNINPDAVDSIEAVVFSETFIGGIELTLTETQEASGIFEGTVEFDPESASDGHRLQVTEGDIVTAAYEDETLPKPDNGDTLEITATTLIGSIVPPLERAPASNPAIVDAFGNSLASVSADQQVQITADLTSGQDRDQDFAYLVQIQNEDGVTVELSWIAGTLGAGATFSASQSWTPDATGSYTATIFVWESVSNPTALSPQLSITIDVV